MKKQLSAIVVSLLFTIGARAQWTTSGTNIYNSNTGNVGIGRSVPPTTKLQVFGGAIQQINADNNSGIFLDATATDQPKLGWRVSDNSERFRIHLQGVNTSTERLAFFKTLGLEAEVFSVLATGNVGIGTTSPELASHIMGAFGFPANSGTNQTGILRLQGTGSNGVLDFSVNGGSGAALQASNRSDLSLHYPLLLNPNGGNVGINTTSPVTSLQVMGASDGGAPTATIPDQGVLISGNATGGALNMGVDATGSLGSFYSWIQSRNRTNTNVYNLALNPTGGNVGIGTISPDALLAVKGTIHSKEVKVDLAGAMSGPDYVFDKNYNLPTLEEIKSYIDQNKHLPEVPSAAEMEKNGIKLGEMNMLLLKKVEELTLHVIESNRKIKEQNARIDRQEKEIKFLKTK